MENASWFEIAFVCVLICGAIFSVWRILNAFRNFQNTLSSEGPLRWIGQFNVETAISILIVQVLFLLWGILLLFLPAGPNTNQVSAFIVAHRLAITYVNRSLIFLAVCVLTVNSIRSVLLRRRIRDIGFYSRRKSDSI